MRTPVELLERLLDHRENARWRFSVTQGQVPVTYILVTSHGRNHAAIEIATKHPEVLTWTRPSEIHLRPSQRTPRETLDTTLPEVTSIRWPARWRDWSIVVTESQGRYRVRLVLLRRARPVHACPVEVITEDERVRRSLSDLSPHGTRARITATPRKEEES